MLLAPTLSQDRAQPRLRKALRLVLTPLIRATGLTPSIQVHSVPIGLTAMLLLGVAVQGVEQRTDRLTAAA